ncbi:PEP-CTERM sorting domain-containing protein [Denitrobaculum tricleocarpae]|uniref:PEP-CTERM sorting domain-containing protein n=1 Tax=Denitrobaculum tricleocarpae TaxID=2591009 RepID=A0A545TAU9_9PROT|nr:PEP-CTERM sorting domain-containing protein [Denitrobaculum tricleocarpae]TQV74314.1 PEP-CTERM sorting domain-containing protein [Denitrobaculum tricleocarpae]
MKKIYAFAISTFVGVAATFGFTSNAHATVILDIVDGQLVGAQNVNVSGTLYDVSFTDGTCIGLFSGCDNAASDFTFTSFQTAFEAATALLEQVFQDTAEGLFSSDPELTRGCEGLAVCWSSIPYQVTSANRFEAMIARNFADNAVDFASGSFTQPSLDYFTFTSDTFAVFSLASGGPIQVDEPGTLLLFGVALLGLGVASRRGRRHEETSST